MARFTNDQNRLTFFFESGAYSATSGTIGIWPGQVQSHSIVDNQNVITTRFLGLGTRNIGTLEDGPRDIEGTVTYFAQDWRMLGYALGSISTTSGTAQTNNYRHSLSEQNGDTRGNAFTSGTLNPPLSFTIEEARDGPIANRNVLRTFKGCVVNTYTINITQGDPVSVELGFMAQTGSYTSGAFTSATAGSQRPYLWSDVNWQLRPHRRD